MSDFNVEIIGWISIIVFVSVFRQSILLLVVLFSSYKILDIYCKEKGKTVREVLVQYTGTGKGTGTWDSHLSFFREWFMFFRKHMFSIQENMTQEFTEEEIRARQPKKWCNSEECTFRKTRKRCLESCSKMYEKGENPGYYFDLHGGARLASYDDMARWDKVKEIDKVSPRECITDCMYLDNKNVLPDGHVNLRSLPKEKHEVELWMEDMASGDNRKMKDLSKDRFQGLDYRLKNNEIILSSEDNNNNGS